MPKNISSARKLEVAKIFPESRRVRAVVASSSVMEKVDWKPCLSRGVSGLLVVKISVEN
jgi:hypothetical protein